MRQQGDEQHVPRPDSPGQVVDAAYYVRVRPGWLEKALFLAVFVQIMLSLMFLYYGFQASAGLGNELKVNRTVVCDLLEKSDPEHYEAAIQLGYCSEFSPIGTST